MSNLLSVASTRIDGVESSNKLNPAPYKRVSEVRSLTGLRGVAALYVVIHHYFLPLPWTSPALRFLAHGYLAVDLFFSLSGFVMALNYAEMFTHGIDRPKFCTFMARRLARIYPLYFFTVLVAALLVAKHLLEFRASSYSVTFWTNIIIVQNWWSWASMNPPAWSLSAEFFAYLLFPFVIPLVMFRSRSTRILVTFMCIAALCCEALYSQFSLHSGPSLNFFSGPLSLIRCSAEFSLGLIAYQFASTRAGNTLKALPGATSTLAIVLLLLLTIRSSDLLVVLLFPVLISMLDGRRTLLSRFLGSGPIQYLGLLSFSIYLSHWLFNPVVGYFDLLARRVGLTHPHTYAVVAVIPIVCLSSVITYYVIEIPGRRLLRTALQPRVLLPAN